MITHRTLIVLVLSLALALGAIGVFVGGLYVIKKEEAALQAQAASIATMRANRLALTKVEQLLAETAPARAEALSYLLTEDTVIDFLALLETTAREVGVVYETTAISTADYSGSLKVLSLTIRASGTYGAVTTFLSILETLPYRSIVDGVSLTTDAAAAAGPASWSLELTLSVVQLPAHEQR
jgi:hypothetical protein